MALTTSLISYWKLDEASGDALDAHGTNTLTDNNTVGSGVGKIGNARDFEFDNIEFFTLADNPSLSVTIGVDFSIACWFKIESFAGQMAIVSKADFSISTEYIVYVGGANQVIFYAGVNNATTVESLSVGVWYYVVAWYDSAAGGTSNVQLNNGTPVSVANSGPLDGVFPFRIGACSDNTRGFDGLIDEVGFWKRVLTAQERTDLYNNGNGFAYPFTPAATTSRIGRVPRNMASPVGRAQRRMGAPIGRAR